MKVCVEARVMININTANCLMNGSTGKIEYMQIPRAGNIEVGIIYVTFGNKDAGNSFKNNLLRD